MIESEPSAAAASADASANEPSPADVRRGRIAAIGLFAVCAVLQVAVTVWAKTSGVSENFLGVFLLDLLLMLAAPVVAIILHFLLPKPARHSFWITGLLCIFLTLLLWGVTCGML